MAIANKHIGEDIAADKEDITFFTIRRLSDSHLSSLLSCFHPSRRCALLALGGNACQKIQTKTYQNLYTDSYFFLHTIQGCRVSLLLVSYKIQSERHCALMRNCSKALSLYEMRLQGIMVVLFIILDWILF